MDKTWRPTLAGIFLIVAGAINLYPIVSTIRVLRLGLVPESATWQFVLSSMPLFVAPGIVAIIGGRAALRRRIWPLALAGVIYGMTPQVFFLLISSIESPLSWVPMVGVPLTLFILALIFLAKSKGEFA